MKRRTCTLGVAALVATTSAHAQQPAPANPPPAAAPPAPVAPAPPPEDAAPAPTPELPAPSGRVVAYLRAPFSDSAIEQASSSVWLELRPRLGSTYAKVVVTGDAFATAVVPAPDFRGRLREGYVGAGSDRLDVRVGQQILPWGNADAVNPTDLLTARDYTFFSADPEANRLGVLSARVSWSPTNWLNVVVVGTPVAPTSTLLLPPALVPAGVAFGAYRAPARTLGNAEEALRVAVTGKGWDAALVGFHGFDHLPEIELRGIEPNGTVDIGLTSHRHAAVGAEASASVAKMVLRAESAYVVTENDDGSNPLIQPSHWDTVVGAERTLFDDRLRIQAQGLARYYPSYAPPEAAVGPNAVTTQVDVAIAQANAVLQDYVAELRIAASARVAYTTTDERFGIEMFALANLNDSHDFLLRPMGTYRPTEALKLEVGAEIYEGPARSPLGALQDYGGAFAQATYEF